MKKIINILALLCLCLTIIDKNQCQMIKFQKNWNRSQNNMNNDYKEKVKAENGKYSGVMNNNYDHPSQVHLNSTEFLDKISLIEMKSNIMRKSKKNLTRGHKSRKQYYINDYGYGDPVNELINGHNNYVPMSRNNIGVIQPHLGPYGLSGSYSSSPLKKSTLNSMLPDEIIYQNSVQLKGLDSNFNKSYHPLANLVTRKKINY